MKKYVLTDEHCAQLKPWADKWIANALSTRPMDETDREIMRSAIKGLYEAAGLKPPPRERIVFVPSPFIARVAGGFAAAIWYARNTATWAATEAATWAAARAATEAATRAATLSATEATRAATEAATLSATWAATLSATWDATWAATWDATLSATLSATEAATRDATLSATEAATWAATRDATLSATWDATLSATRAATEAATLSATWAATLSATEAATLSATLSATEAATRDATLSATEAATWAATLSATLSATEAATRAATWAATEAAEWWEFADIRRMAAIILGPLADFGLSCAYYANRMWQGGNQWSSGDSFISFFRHIAQLPLSYEQWQHWELASEHGGPRIMHPEFCIVSDRPRVLLVDSQNRPHCEDGPFCRWSDGAALYCLNGVRVPKWLVMTAAADLDPAKIATIDNAEVRREFVRKIGAEQIVQALSGGAIDKATFRTADGREHPYELHRLEVAGEPWTYLRMVNPSVGLTHFEGVPNSCLNVRDALIFRAGLNPAQIDDDKGAEWHQQGDVILRPRGAETFRLFPSSLS